jgi:hypothetical protein
MDNLTPESILIRSDDIVSRDIEGELIIVPITSGIGDLEDELYTLNETGNGLMNVFPSGYLNRSGFRVFSSCRYYYPGCPGTIRRTRKEEDPNN